MSQQNIGFQRQVFNKKSFNDTIDTEFTQLVETLDILDLKNKMKLYRHY